jgi:hypothetical protein
VLRRLAIVPILKALTPPELASLEKTMQYKRYRA